DPAAAVAEVVVQLVMRVAAGAANGQGTLPIVEPKRAAIGVLVGTEAVATIAAVAPLTVAATPDAEPAARVGRAVHLQRNLAREQLTLVVQRIGVSAVGFRARLVEERLGLGHG